MTLLSKNANSKDFGRSPEDRRKHVIREQARGRDIKGSKGSGSGVVATNGGGEATRRDETRRSEARRGEARYDDGDDGRVLVACRRRSQALLLRVPPSTPQSCDSLLCHYTPRALPRWLLIPSGRYPHGVLNWDGSSTRWVEMKRRVLGRIRKQRDAFKLQ